MNMKMLTAALLSGIALCVEADDVDAKGGLVRRPSSGKVIAIVNAQTKVVDNRVSEMGHSIETLLTLPVKVSSLKGGNLFGMLESQRRAAATIVLLDNNEPRSTFLVAPEEGWAIVNVGELSSDKPPEDVLERRVQKEIWRGVTYLVGGTDAEFQPCLMRKIRSLKDLDEYPKLLVPAPMTFSKILQRAECYGILPVVEDTYLNACRQGWAPPPTNELQKAIWDKVHAIPKTPMKIEFDPKKGR